MMALPLLSDWPRRLCWTFYFAATTLCVSRASAQFSTVINVPPDIVPTPLQSDTQLNLHPGGALPPRFDAGSRDGLTSNIEINVVGGSVGSGFLSVYSGTSVNIRDGSVGYVGAYGGSIVNLFGGIHSGYVTADDNGVVAVRGGALDGLRSMAGSEVTIFGGEFRLDGVLIDGLESPGSAVSLDLPMDPFLLSGTLADGTPFAFAYTDGDVFETGTLTLEAVELPPIGPSLITASTDPVPLGIRSGQTLRVDAGGVVPSSFSAGLGSRVLVEGGGSVRRNLAATAAEVVITGGTIDEDFSAFGGSTVTITGGTVGREFLLVGSRVDISGGSIGNSFRAESGAEVNISAGFVERLAAYDTIVNVSGGEIDGLGVGAGSVANISGGSFNGFGATEGSSVTVSEGTFREFGAHDVTVSGGSFGRFSADNGSISGGSFGDGFNALKSTVTIHGGDFRLDGIPVEGLETEGSSRLLELPVGTLFSGVLADGVPFAFFSEDDDFRRLQTTTLTAATLPAIGPSLITASTDAVPRGIRGGQTLRVDAGGVVQDNFNAGLGSRTTVEEGGVVGDNLEAVGAEVEITGGSVGQYFDAFGGSMVSITGGTVGWYSDVFRSTVEISHGAIGNEFRVAQESTIRISGGSIGREFTLDDSTLDVSGGEIGDLRANRSVVTISAGRFQDDIISSESEVLVSGSAELGSIIASNGSDVSISGGTIHGRVTVRGGSRANISGGSVSHFTAESGGVVNVTGGSIPHNFSSNAGGTVNFSGGSATAGFSAGSGSVVNITGGSVIGGNLRANGGSTVSISGGRIGEALRAFSASRVNLLGGVIGDRILADTGSRVTVSGGDFHLDGALIDGLEEEESTLFLNVPQGSVVSGTFADGTPFAFSSGDGDSIADGSLVLQAAALPPTGPALIVTPTDEVPLGIRQGQTLRVGSGGAVPSHFSAGHGSALEVEEGGAVGDNLEAAGAAVTLAGGTVGSGFDLFAGSTLTISSGSVGDGFYAGRSMVNMMDGSIGTGFIADNQSTVNIAGGAVSTEMMVDQATVNLSAGMIGDEFFAGFRSTINMSGGSIGHDANSYDHSMVNISGGYVGRRFQVQTGSTVSFSGGSIDDSISLVGKMRIIGGEFRLNGVPVEGLDEVGNTLLLPDELNGLLSGTLADGTPFAFSSTDGDTTLRGVITLEATVLPPVGPPMINASTDPVPLGIREGQTLRVDDGGFVPRGFSAGRGSTLLLENGGGIGRNLEATGAVVNMMGGTVGADFDAFSGSEVAISGGLVGSGFQAHNGSIVTISGGEISDQFIAFSGSEVTISGGSIGYQFQASDTVNIDGGSVGSNFTAQSGSFVTISGGSIGERFTVEEGGRVRIFGGSVADMFRAFRGSRVTITGGTVGDLFSASGIVNISGGTIGDSMTTAFSSTMNMTGGTIGDNFNAKDGGTVNISGGSFGSGFHAFRNAVVNISGGFIGIDLLSESGSRVTVSGGTLGDSPEARGGEIIVTGGSVGRRVRSVSNGSVVIGGGAIGDELLADNGGSITIEGGVVGDNVGVLNNGQLRFSGGTVGDDFDAFGGSRMTISGGEFFLGGVPVAGLDVVGSTVPLEVPAGSLLTGTLADGTPFVFDSADGDSFAPGTLTLEAAALPPVGPPLITASTDAVPLGMRSGQTLVVDEGGIVADSFTAVAGSTVRVERGGTVGRNLELVGAALEMTGGEVGAAADAFAGTEVTVSGGEIGSDFQVHDGSLLTVYGGSVGERLRAYAGSRVTISGGLIGDGLKAIAGSEVHLIGREFFLDGVPLEGLSTPGDSLVHEQRAGRLLTGLFLDRHPFEFHLNAMLTLTGDFFDPSATLRLTVAVPEPPAWALAILACGAAWMLFVTRVRAGHRSN